MLRIELFFEEDTNKRSWWMARRVIGVLNSLKYLQTAGEFVFFFCVLQKKSEFMKNTSPAVVPTIMNLWYCAIWLTNGCNRSLSIRVKGRLLALGSVGVWL